MLTRIRIEAEGTTVNVVQDDIYAAYDAIVGVIWGPGVYHPARLGDEVIEQADVPADLALYTPRWYKGRAIMRFPADSPHEIDSNRLRPRIEWFARQDEHARSPSERAPLPSTPDSEPRNYVP
jgi:hypothetical protein